MVEAGQVITVTSNPSRQATSSCLPIGYPGDLDGCGLKPGSSIFVGQYLFTGSETTSAYLTVQVRGGSF